MFYAGRAGAGMCIIKGETRHDQLHRLRPSPTAIMPRSRSIHRRAHVALGVLTVEQRPNKLMTRAGGEHGKQGRGIHDRGCSTPSPPLRIVKHAVAKGHPTDIAQAVDRRPSPTRPGEFMTATGGMRAVQPVRLPGVVPARTPTRRWMPALPPRSSRRQRTLANDPAPDASAARTRTTATVDARGDAALWSRGPCVSDCDDLVGRFAPDMARPPAAGGGPLPSCGWRCCEMLTDATSTAQGRRERGRRAGQGLFGTETIARLSSTRCSTRCFEPVRRRGVDREPTRRVPRQETVG